MCHKRCCAGGCGEQRCANTPFAYLPPPVQMTNKTVVLFGIPSQNKVLINEAGCVAIPSVCFALSPALAAALLPAHCWALPTVKLREFLRAKGN